MVGITHIMIGIILVLCVALVIYFIVIKNNTFHKIHHEEEKFSVTPEMKEKIKNAILKAFDQDGFVIVYQPIFSKFDLLKAAEALVRLQDDELGEIMPEMFIPIAEEMECMVEVGKRVFEQVAKFISEHDMERMGLSYIEINLSASEFTHGDIVPALEETLAAYGVDKKYINIQIPEKVLAMNHGFFIQNMQKLSDQGVNFSLDKYGTGASTLAYIMTLPFQYVKIDKDVLQQAQKNKRTLDALRASINTLKDFSMKIVVEGVETKEMAEWLKKVGCDLLQGYYYSKPLSVSDFEHFCLTMTDS